MDQNAPVVGSHFHLKGCSRIKAALLLKLFWQRDTAAILDFEEKPCRSQAIPTPQALGLCSFRQLLSSRYIS